jgi:hypothetical protein
MTNRGDDWIRGVPDGVGPVGEPMPGLPLPDYTTSDCVPSRKLPPHDPSAHENPDGPLFIGDLPWRERLRVLLTGRTPQ